MIDILAKRANLVHPRDLVESRRMKGLLVTNMSNLEEALEPIRLKNEAYFRHLKIPYSNISVTSSKYSIASLKCWSVFSTHWSLVANNTIAACLLSFELG